MSLRSRRRAGRHGSGTAARHQAADAAWQREDADLCACIERAEAFRGMPAEEAGGPLVPKRDERVLATVPGVILVESARAAGSSAQPTADVRYTLGPARGTAAPGAVRLKTIDMGTVVVTDQRVSFHGRVRTREWAYSKLVGYAHDDRMPCTTFQVSDRRRVSGLLYPATVTGPLRFDLALAVAIFDGTVPAFVARLEVVRAEHRAHRPSAVADAKVARTEKHGRRILQAG